MTTQTVSKRRSRCKTYEDPAVAKACGGRIRESRYWKSSGYPETDIPGGRAAWSYSDSIEFEIRATPAQAVRIAAQLTAVVGGCDK